MFNNGSELGASQSASQENLNGNEMQESLNRAAEKEKGEKVNRKVIAENEEIIRRNNEKMEKIRQEYLKEFGVDLGSGNQAQNQTNTAPITNTNVDPVGATAANAPKTSESLNEKKTAIKQEQKNSQGFIGFLKKHKGEIAGVVTVTIMLGAAAVIKSCAGDGENPNNTPDPKDNNEPVITSEAIQDQSEVEAELPYYLNFGSAELNEQLDEYDEHDGKRYENTGCALFEMDKKTSPNAVGNQLPVWKSLLEGDLERATEAGDMDKVNEYKALIDDIEKVSAKDQRLSEADFQALRPRIPEDVIRRTIAFTAQSEDIHGIPIMQMAALAGVEDAAPFKDISSVEEGQKIWQEMFDAGDADKIMKTIYDVSQYGKIEYTLQDPTEALHKFGTTCSVLGASDDGEDRLTLIPSEIVKNDPATYTTTISISGKWLTLSDDEAVFGVTKRDICENDWTKITSAGEEKDSADSEIVLSTWGEETKTAGNENDSTGNENSKPKDTDNNKRITDNYKDDVDDDHNTDTNRPDDPNAINDETKTEEPHVQPQESPEQPEPEVQQNPEEKPEDVKPEEPDNNYDDNKDDDNGGNHDAQNDADKNYDDNNEAGQEDIEDFMKSLNNTNNNNQ